MASPRSNNNSSRSYSRLQYPNSPKFIKISASDVNNHTASSFSPIGTNNINQIKEELPKIWKYEDSRSSQQPTGKHPLVSKAVLNPRFINLNPIPLTVNNTKPELEMIPNSNHKDEYDEHEHIKKWVYNIKKVQKDIENESIKSTSESEEKFDSKDKVNSQSVGKQSWTFREPAIDDDKKYMPTSNKNKNANIDMFMHKFSKMNKNGQNVFHLFFQCPAKIRTCVPNSWNPNAIVVNICSHNNHDSRNSSSAESDLPILKKNRVLSKYSLSSASTTFDHQIKNSVSKLSNLRNTENNNDRKLELEVYKTHLNKHIKKERCNKYNIIKNKKNLMCFFFSLVLIFSLFLGCNRVPFNLLIEQIRLKIIKSPPAPLPQEQTQGFLNFISQLFGGLTLWFNFILRYFS